MERGGEGGVGFRAIFPLVRIPHRQEERGRRAIGVKGPRILHTDIRSYTHTHTHTDKDLVHRHETDTRILHTDIRSCTHTET